MPTLNGSCTDRMLVSRASSTRPTAPRSRSAASSSTAARAAWCCSR